MTVESTILGAVRSLLKATCADADLTNAQVIKADQPGARPPLPYLTVKVGSPVHQGQPGRQDKYTSGVNLTRYHSTYALSEVSIQGFGAGSLEWLEQARMALGTYEAQALTDSLGVSFQDYTEIIDVSALLDTSIEPHYSVNLRCSVLLRLTEAVPLASTVTVTTSGDIASTRTIPV